MDLVSNDGVGSGKQQGRFGNSFGTESILQFLLITVEVFQPLAKQLQGYGMFRILIAEGEETIDPLDETNVEEKPLGITGRHLGRGDNAGEWDWVWALEIEDCLFFILLRH